MTLSDELAKLAYSGLGRQTLAQGVIAAARRDARGMTNTITTGHTWLTL